MSFYSPGLNKGLPPIEWLEHPDGGTLAFFAYPAKRPWLHILISHGFSEHSGWWHHVASTLRDKGISTYVFDHFHHGRSTGRVGDVVDYHKLENGLKLALDKGVVPRRKKGEPLVVLAHSNGALVTLLAHQDGLIKNIDGFVMASPLLGLPAKIRWVVQPLFRVLQYILPTMRIPSTSIPWNLTGNRSVWKYYLRDSLRFQSMTPRFFMAMSKAIERARRQVKSLPMPVFFMGGSREKVVDDVISVQWFDGLQAPDKTRKIYPGFKHELFNETRWEDVLEDMLEWCESRFGEARATGSTDSLGSTDSRISAASADSMDSMDSMDSAASAAIKNPRKSRKRA